MTFPLIRGELGDANRPAPQIFYLNLICKFNTTPGSTGRWGPDGGHEFADTVSKMGRRCRMGVRVREPRCRSNRAGSCSCLLRHTSCGGRRAVEAHFNGTLQSSRVKFRLNTRNKRLIKRKTHSPLVGTTWNDQSDPAIYRKRGHFSKILSWYNHVEFNSAWLYRDQFLIVWENIFIVKSHIFFRWTSSVNITDCTCAQSKSSKILENPESWDRKFP